MAISDSAKVDLLYKKYFGVTKTDLPANKSPSNESIASPLIVRGDTIWQQSDQIPAVASATTGIVQAYTGATAVECTADTTSVPVSSVYPSWKTNLNNWISSEFGSTYFVQVWVDSSGVANPTSTGTRIYDAGSGGTGEWNFDYSAGVLNFIGGTIPAVLTTSKVIYVVGYRYIGATGIGSLAGNITVGNVTANNKVTASEISTTNLAATYIGTVLDPVDILNVDVVQAQGNVTTGNVSGTKGTFTEVSVTTINATGNINVSGNVTAPNVLSDRGFDQNNWDTLTQIGVYAINRVSWSGVTGAPTDSLVFTGLLEVLSSSNLSTVQIFRPNDGSTINPNVEFIRSKFSTGGWTAWVKMINNFQIVDCGSY